MSEQKLAAEVRTEFGKGFARRARMANLIPAVIYGHGAEPIHITLPAKATTLAVRTANALLSLDVNGEEHLALVKDVQRDPIRQIIEHIDLLTVIKGEKVTVDIPVHLVGELAPGQRLQPGTHRYLPRGRGNPPAHRHRGQTSKAAPPDSTSTLPTSSCRRAPSCWPTPMPWLSTSPRPPRSPTKRPRLPLKPLPSNTRLSLQLWPGPVGVRPQPCPDHLRMEQ